MNRKLEIESNSLIYGQIAASGLSPAERGIAVSSLHKAESFVDGLLKLVDAVQGLFSRPTPLKPSLKH